MTAANGADGANHTVRLAELLGALSYALDLTEGQPVGHCVRSTWIGMQVGKRMGLAESQMWELYYTILLKDLGCSSNAARICELYLSDDLAFKRDSKTLGPSLPKVLGFVISHTGRRSPLGDRLRAILNIMRNGGSIVDDLIQTRCHRGAQIASRLRFPTAVSDGIYSLDEHWDGGGRPDGLAGSNISIYSRIALLSQVVDVFHTAAGSDAALTEVRNRRGSWLDPQAVDCLEALADRSFWSTLKSRKIETLVFDLAPATRSVPVDEDYLDDIARAFAQIVDSKSSFTAGHSERVTVYADLVAAEMGCYSSERRRWLRRAALLHDIGKLGVSNAILDKNGKLDDEEWIKMRRHASMSESILSRVPVFSSMARIGGAHHEKLDGSGYPRGLSAGDIDQETRIVSVADVFDALTADRPYRSAIPTAKALDIMRADIGRAFDPNCFEALERAIAATEGTLALVA